MSLSAYIILTECGVDLMADLVPPSGVEPELPEEPHFECGASANSAKGAGETDAMGCSQKSTLPHPTQLQAGRLSETLGLGDMRLIAASARLADLEHCVRLPSGWDLRFMYDTRGYWYAQVGDPRGTCNVTGEPLPWWSRKWLISEHMTDGEIVQTVFKAVMTAAEHEIREGFKYRGQAIFDPHYDLEKLVELRSRADALKEREQRNTERT